MQLILKYINDIITRENKKQERNLLSELRLTEAILRSDLNEISSKLERELKKEKSDS